MRMIRRCRALLFALAILAHAADPDLQPWSAILSHRPPLSVQTAIEQRTASTVSFRNWYVQFVEDGIGNLNLDWYGVSISRMPMIAGSAVTATGLLEYVRLHFADFLAQVPIEFRPYDTAAGQTWNSNSPLGAVLQFKITDPVLIPNSLGRNFAVVCSDKQANRWIFSTVHADLAPFFYHPVSGNREFGITRSSDNSYTFYTRGADRISNPGDNQAVDMVFRGGGEIWAAFVINLAAFVNQHGGAAVVLRAQASHAYIWTQIRTDYFKPSVARIGLEGIWESYPDRRFRLEVTASGATLIERKGTESLSRPARLVKQQDGYRIKRDNDEAVIRFLLSNSALQDAVIEAAPSYSYMDVERIGDTLDATWSGFLASLSSTGELRLTQPDDVDGKSYTLRKVYVD